jgi:serine/threonine-protein kinase
MSLTPDADLRALDLFERLVSYPNNPRFRARVLKGQTDAVLDRLAQLEAGHAARGAMPTEAVDAASTAVEEAPAKIGVYRLVEEVGRGGMGDVWRAERDDGLFEQTVAIKLIRTNLTAQALAAFDFERQVLAKLDHPNIVRLIDGGVTADGRPYLIMDYVQGAPFDAAIAPLAFQQKIALFIQAASAAQFAHERLTAHGDLKPSNILIDADGRVRLLDFGVSELIVAEAPVRATPGAFTRDFASPQRRAGEPPSIADDVFALGRILEPIVAERPDQELLAVVRKASAPEVQDRYATVAALIADLENWRAGRPVGALPDRFVYRTRKFVSRHLAAVLATSLAATLLIAATILATAASLRAEHARAEASARFEDARGTARYLLFTLLDKLEAKPNTLSLRTEVAGVAQHYLDRLSHAAAAMPEVRLEAARGYLRLAEAQGVPGFQNLDEGALAQSNLEKALALLPDTRPEAVAEVAIRALIEEVHISTYINNDADTALRRLDRADGLAAAHPALPVQLRARLLAERADTLGWKLQWGPSIANAQAALKLLDGQTSLDAFMTRAYALETIAVGRGNLRPPSAAIRTRWRSTTSPSAAFQARVGFAAMPHAPAGNGAPAIRTIRPSARCTSSPWRRRICETSPPSIPTTPTPAASRTTPMRTEPRCWRRWAACPRRWSSFAAISIVSARPGPAIPTSCNG